jgi:hypothetical protein
MTHSHASDRSDKVSDEAVEQALRELDRFGRRIGRGFLRSPQAAVTVEVRSLAPLGTDNEKYVVQQVEAYGVTAAWLGSVSVVFLIAEQRIAKQSVQVRVVPDQDQDATRADVKPPLARQLVLAQGTLRAQVLVVVDDEPRPLIRRDHGDPVAAGSLQWVQVPDRFDVPRGALLYLIRHDGPDGQPAVAVLRSEERPDVTVAVGDTALVPGSPPFLLGDDGEVAFHVEGRPIPYRLEYRFVEPGHRRLFSGDTSGDPTPMSLDMVARRREVRLLIEPPPLHEPIRLKEFPVPVPGQGDVMRVEILYSTAVTESDPEEQWHVKLYACATPQHAALLRRYLRTQARLITKVNGAARDAGGEGQVIAPVFLAPPLTETKAVRETGLRMPAPDPEVAVEAERLSIWFGSPDVPQPDSFVVVASPLLEPVRWPMTCESPDLDALTALEPVARALSLCHAQGALHGDVTPQNVCADDNGYVLVDGDAITPLDSGYLLRRNVYYTSRSVSDLVEGRRTSRPDGPGFDLREHDRFGFALLALTALAGSGTTNSLLVADGGVRDVDDPDLVVGELQDQWRDEQPWPHLIAELTAPLRRGVLQENWDPVSWLDRLRSAAADDLAGGDRVPSIRTPAVADPFAEGIRQKVQTEMQHGLLHRDVGPAVLSLLDARLLAEARHAEMRARLWALVPIGIGAVLLVGAIVGR